VTSLRDLADLVRAPASLTVLGDAAVGAYASGQGLRGRGWLLPLASVALYSGGMALNDWADREVDAAERPERPIPSGRVSARAALAVVGVCTAAGLTLAALGGGRRAFVAALPLAASILAYDTVAKSGSAGPIVMAACRGLDVLMGAGGSARAVPAALTVAVHTAGVTAISRGEVHGGSSAQVGAALVATGAAAAAVDGAGSSASPVARGLAAVGTAGYLASALPGHLAAAEDPSPSRVRAATRAGIGSIVPLQAALVARSGGYGVAVGLAGIDAVRRRLSARRRSGDIT
jgi:4-hydroxybenzoate polyprenyltransferase